MGTISIQTLILGLSPFVFVAFWSGPFAVRIVRSIPATDVHRISVFLGERDEVIVSVTKMWFGGPWGRTAYRRSVQTGRPYKVMALASDGQEYRHRLVFDSADMTGKLIPLQERQGRFWFIAS